MPNRPITLAPVRCLGQAEAPAPAARARKPAPAHKAASPRQSRAERAEILRQNFVEAREKIIAVIVFGGHPEAAARATVDMMMPLD